MRILITGATGFIGKRLCQKLSAQGHSLVVLSRNPEAARKLPISAAHRWLPESSLPPPESWEEIETVIHLAGESVAGRWTQRKKQRIYDSRILSTRHLVEALRARKDRPKTLICASAIGYYGDRGEETLNETATPGRDFLASVCQDWEAAALQAERLGVRVVCLRLGIVLGRGGGALPAMLLPFKLGLGGPLGSGQQWWSWVHHDDVIGLIEHALARPELHGPLNVTAPTPVRQREFAQILGRLLRRPAFMPTPGFALKMALGDFANELLASKRVIPQRAQESGYRFCHADLEAALRDALF